jgi:outer membrane protein TolC
MIASILAAAMTLPDAVSYALGHSSAVAAQRAAVAQAQHAVALQRGSAYPTLDAMLQSFLAKSAHYQGQFAVIGQVQQNVVSQNTAQIGIVNWDLTTGGFSFLALAAARAQEEQARNVLASTEDHIASSVTSAFFGIAQKQAVVSVDEATLKYQSELADVARVKVKAGVAAGVDVLQALTSAAKSQSILIADRAAVADASEALAQQIGAPLQTQFALPTVIPRPPLPHGSADALVAIAGAHRADVAAAEQAVIAARDTRRGWNVELFPQVSISAAFGNQFSPTSAVFEQQQLDSECLRYHILPFCGVTVPRGSPGFWNLQAISTFSLPLVDYGARHSERVNDDEQLASAQAAYEQTRLQAELDVRRSYRAARAAQAQLAWAKQEAAYGTESARIAQLQYKAGVKTIFDVLQAQQAAAQAQDDLINARVGYVDAVVALRVALGTYTAQSAVADL